MSVVFKNFKTDNPIADGAWLVKALALKTDEVLSQLDELPEDLRWENVHVETEILRQNKKDSHAWLIEAVPSQKIKLHRKMHISDLDIWPGDTIVRLPSLSLFLVFSQRHGLDESTIKDGSGKTVPSPANHSLVGLIQLSATSKYVGRPSGYLRKSTHSNRTSMVVEPAEVSMWQYPQNNIRIRKIEPNPFVPVRVEAERTYLSLDWKCLVSLWELVANNPWLLIDDDREKLDTAEWEQALAKAHADSSRERANRLARINGTTQNF